MTSILAAISGSFSRALILGTFFPVTVFVLCGLLFVVPFLPGEVPLLAPLAQLDPGWKMALVTLVILLLTGLLYTLNTPLIRLYEGYPWQRSWLGKRAIARQARRRAWAESKRAAVRDLISEIKEANRAEAVRRKAQRKQAAGSEAEPREPAPEVASPPDPTFAELEIWRSRLGQRVTSEYPGGALVLPTRLGNVIRAFEEYPRAVYGISAISLWPRLIAVVDKDYKPVLDEAKASLDFMINASFLSGLLSASIFVAGLVVPERIHWVSWLLQLSLAALAARLFYVASIGQATAWGAQVKSAFDLFRWDLLKKLGYERPGITPEAERELWQQISQRMIYGNPPEGVRLMPYVRPAKPKP
ncbi:MAG TPA: hypothetical protein VF710_02180 [Longimicrobium sp.]|jgi:hypothetical protein